MPIGGALASARIAQAGFGGYALVITITLILEAGCAWTMERVGARVYSHTVRKPEPLQNRYFQALYFAAMLWIVFTAFATAWLSSATLRLIR